MHYFPPKWWCYVGALFVRAPRGTEEGVYPSKKQGASKKGFLEELLRSKVDGTICGTIHFFFSHIITSSKPLKLLLAKLLDDASKQKQINKKLGPPQGQSRAL